jgi:hypothetical protein
MPSPYNFNKANLVDGLVPSSELPELEGDFITSKSTVTAVGTDYVLISDTSDSGNLKKALVSDFGGGLTQQQIEGII